MRHVKRLRRVGAEHAAGLGRVADRDPHTLALGLGLLSLVWGAWVSLWPEAWGGVRIYAPLVYLLPGWAVGLPMVGAGLVQLAAATNGIMLGRLAKWAIVIQACVWGAVSTSAWRVSPWSTGTPIYTGLTLLSLLLWWQWRGAARRGGRLPSPPASRRG